MSSTNKFPSGLNNWLGSDKPQRADFVNDNAILDEHAMWKQEYDPDGSVAAAGGIAAELQRQKEETNAALLNIADWTAGKFTNPAPSVWQLYDLEYRFNASLAILEITGSCHQNNATAVNTPAILLSNIPGMTVFPRVGFAARGFDGTTAGEGRLGVSLIAKEGGQSADALYFDGLNRGLPLYIGGNCMVSTYRWNETL